MAYDRITMQPDKLGGAPCIRGLRIPVATVLEMLAQGMSRDEVVEHLPDLTHEDIDQALAFAAESLRERTLPAVGT